MEGWFLFVVLFVCLCLGEVEGVVPPLPLKPHNWLLALQQTWRPGKPPPGGAGARGQHSQLSCKASVDFANRANRPSLKEKQKQQNSAFLPISSALLSKKNWF